MAKSRHSTNKVNKKSRKYVCRQRKRIGGTHRKAPANAMGSQSMAAKFYAARDADPNAKRATRDDHCCCKMWELLFGGPGGATYMDLKDHKNCQFI